MMPKYWLGNSVPYAHFTNPEEYVVYNVDQKVDRGWSGNDCKACAKTEGISEIILSKVSELSLRNTLCSMLIFHVV